MAGGASAPDPPPSPEYHTLPSSGDGNDAVLSDHASYRRLRIIVITIFLISLASVIVYIFWPSDPRINIVRLRIAHIHMHLRPVLSVDMSLLVTLKVSNADVYSFDYTSLHVAVAYRGKALGHVTSEGGHVRAMGSSCVVAETELDGVKVFPDVIHLLHDLAEGSVEFDAVTETNGKLGLLFFRFPLKAKLACGIVVNTVNQTISHQHCYPA